MPQKISPFVEGKYGWNFGESGWNSGMDENLLKFSFMFTGVVDNVVNSLPTPTNGLAVFLRTDNRFYFSVGTTWYSCPCPIWFVFKVKSTGQFRLFNGTEAVVIDNPSQISSKLSAVELTVSLLGSAAFEDADNFATQDSLDVIEAQANSYADTKTATVLSDLQNTSDTSKGATLIGYRGRSLRTRLNEVKSVKDFGALGDGSTDDSAAINAAFAGGGIIYFPAGVYIARNLVMDSSAVVYGVPGKSVIKRPAGTSGGILQLSGGNVSFAFRDMTFDGDYQNQTPFSSRRMLDYTYEGLEGSGQYPADLRVENCQFMNVEMTGIRYVGNSAGFNRASVVITGCKFIRIQPGTPTFAPAFVGISNGANVVVSDNFFDSRLDVETEVTSTAISITKRSSTSEPGGMVVTGNQIFRCGRGGAGISDQLGAIEFYSDAAQVLIANNRLYNSNGRTITGKTDSPNCIIIGNSCINDQSRPTGIGILAAANGSTTQADNHRWIIANNIVKRTDAGIRIEGRTLASYVVLQGNIIDDAEYVGGISRSIFVSNVSSVLIDSNIVSGRPNYSWSGIVTQGCPDASISNNRIENALDGLVFNSATSTYASIIGNTLSGIRQYGVNAFDVASIVVRSNNLYGSTGVVGVRTRNATAKSPIRGNLISGFTTPVSATPDPNAMYVQGEND